MKKFYLSALSTLFGLGVNAQVTLNQANHAPVNGDQYSTYQCDSAMNLGANGAGQVWTFTNIAVHSSILTSNTVITNSNPTYTNANITVTSNPSSSNYYQTGANDYKYWGGNITFGGFATVLTFSTPAIYMTYPTSLGTNTNSTFSGAVSVLGTNGTYTGVCSVTASATGTLTVPGFTLPNVIRVMTTIALNATVVPSTTVAATQMSYDFYSPSNSKFPILSVVSSTISSQVGGTSTQKNAYIQKAFTPLGIQEGKFEASSAIVYPNPATNQISIVSQAGTLEFFDLSGKLVATHSTEGHLNLNVSSYSNGFYTYKLTESSGKVKTGKFTVSH
jgi:hypothetical protein